MAIMSIATVQSLTGFGKSSLSVALPILSASGIETSVLPTAMLSAHTGYSAPEKADMNGFTEASLDNWSKNGFIFDALYSGYLCNQSQIESIIKNKGSILKENGIFFCDPAMGDGGKLYSGFQNDFPKFMLNLCKNADIIFPNVTEACFMTDTTYLEKYDKEYIEELVLKLKKITCSTVVLTGVCLNEKTISTVLASKDSVDYVETERQPDCFHGSGDIFTSVFIAYYLRGCDLIKSAEFASHFVSLCIKDTLSLKRDEKCGIVFEKRLNSLTVI